MDPTTSCQNAHPDIHQRLQRFLGVHSLRKLHTSENG
jgi:hypothetical protein